MLRLDRLVLLALLALAAARAGRSGAGAGRRPIIVAQGEYLARAGDCIACHTAPDGKLFAGGRAMPTPFGTLYTSNITPDDETGIGKWTADEFYRMMHTGRFPRRRAALSGDAVRLLHQGHARRLATRSSPICARSRRCKQPNRPHDLRFPYNNRSLILGWRTLFFNEGEYKPDPKQVGRMEPRRLSRRGPRPLRDVPHADQRARRQLGIGGVRGRADPDAELVRALAHLEQGGGLGDWSIKDIADLLQTGVSQRGAVYGPMAEVVYNSLQYLTDDDIRAMAVYLKSLGQGSPPRRRGLGDPDRRRAAC